MLDAARGVAEGSDYDTTQEEIVVTYGGPTNVESGTGTTGTRNERRIRECTKEKLRRLGVWPVERDNELLS